MKMTGSPFTLIVQDKYSLNNKKMEQCLNTCTTVIYIDHKQRQEVAREQKLTLRPKVNLMVL